MQRFLFWEFLATGCWSWSVTSSCIDFLQVIFIELQILTKTHIRCNCLMLTYQRLISWTKTEKVEMSRIGAAAVSPCSAPSYLEIDSNYYVIIKFYIISYKLGKTSIEKKRFLSGIARMMGGGVYPCPNFLALFLEVHFWSIKRVYFFKNANVLNF